MNVLIQSKNSYYTLGMVNIMKGIARDLKKQTPIFYFRQPIKNEPEGMFLNKEYSPGFKNENSFISNQQISILLMQSEYDQKLSPVRWHYVVRRRDSLCEVRRKLHQASILLDVISSDIFSEQNSVLTKNLAIGTKEERVIECFGRGYSPAKTARFLDLNIKTVSHYKRSVMRKLNMKNNCEFYRYAINSVKERFEKDM